MMVCEQFDNNNDKLIVENKKKSATQTYVNNYLLSKATKDRIHDNSSYTQM